MNQSGCYIAVLASDRLPATWNLARKQSPGCQPLHAPPRVGHRAPDEAVNEGPASNVTNVKKRINDCYLATDFLLLAALQDKEQLDSLEHRKVYRRERESRKFRPAGDGIAMLLELLLASKRNTVKTTVMKVVMRESHQNYGLGRSLTGRQGGSRSPAATPVSTRRGSGLVVR